MNCGLALLLIATLYTIGCAQGVQITVKDAKTAITAAWNLYNGAQNRNIVYTATITLESGTSVQVTCKFGGKRLDCYLPAGQYLLPENKADEVGNWFLSAISSCGRYLKPQDKNYGGRFANLWKQANQKSFNYHLEVPKSLKSKLLRMIMSRLSQ